MGNRDLSGRLIERMVHIYAPEAKSHFAEWMMKWGEGLDLRYIE
jgi:hypothetical protein